jgi:inner membrane protein involved in colicin E2 resistance
MRIVDPVDTYRMLPRLERTATLGCIFILFYSLQFVGSGIFHIGSALRVASVGILIAGASLFF